MKTKAWWQHPSSFIGFALLAAYFVVAAVGPWLAPACPVQPHLDQALGKKRNQRKHN